MINIRLAEIVCECLWATSYTCDTTMRNYEATLCIGHKSFGWRVTMISSLFFDYAYLNVPLFFEVTNRLKLPLTLFSMQFKIKKLTALIDEKNLVFLSIVMVDIRIFHCSWMHNVSCLEDTSYSVEPAFILSRVMFLLGVVGWKNARSLFIMPYILAVCLYGFSFLYLLFVYIY